MARVGFDWPRVVRYCLLGTIVMVCVLMWPVARCSWRGYMATPISEYDPNATAPGSTDKSRVEGGKNFAGDVWESAKACYAATPLLGQESWKSSLLFAFLGVGIAAFAIGKLTARRRQR